MKLNIINIIPRCRLAAGAAFAAALMAGAASAHHSYAMFDLEKEVTASATVRVWQFTSPHATLWVYIKDAQDKSQLWALEAPGPSQLVRNGWDKETVKPGDKVTVILNPLRDGRNGGSLVRLTLADGRKMEMGGGPPQASAAGAGETR